MGEQGRLLPPYPGPDLHNDVLVVVGVLGQQQNLNFPLQPGDVLQGLVIFLLGQLPHLRVAQQRMGLVPGLQRLLIGAEGLHQGGKLRLLLVQPGHLGRVVIGLRRGQPGLDLAVFRLDGNEFIQHSCASFSQYGSGRWGHRPLLSLLLGEGAPAGGG